MKIYWYWVFDDYFFYFDGDYWECTSEGKFINPGYKKTRNFELIDEI